MKMTKNHYTALQELINQVINHHPTILQEYQNRNLSMMRYRWDLYHAATIHNRELTHEIYQYLDDNNIDTALRSITNTK